MPSPTPDTSVLYCDENAARLAEMLSESVDLIYLDPPFFSNRVYEVIWGDEAEVRSFEDRWEGGMHHYVGWMRERVEEMRRILKPTGTLYLHCDPTASHHLKVMLDDVFGMSRFRNEIIWQRVAAKGGKMNRLPANHDVILTYGKGASSTWNEIRLPYNADDLDEKTLSKYRHIDEEGRRYRLGPLLHPEQGQRPNLEYELMGVVRTWRWSKDRMQEAVESGRVIQTAPGRVPQQKMYLDEQPGRLVGDVWTDVDVLNSRARERLGYPTQKPEALLERIVRASSNKKDVVLDPFCGCGTTVAVAERLGRRWIGIDISPTAIEVMRRRFWLQNPSLEYHIEGLPDTVDKLKQLKPFEFQNWVIAQINGTHSPRKVHDMGIDGYAFMTRDPVQVKQSEKVGRNVIDNFETALRRAGSDTGYVIAFSYTRGAREEVARAKWEDGIYIHLVKVSDLLRPSEQRPSALRPEPDVVQLPDIRKREDRPSVEELIASDKADAVSA